MPLTASVLPTVAASRWTGRRHLSVLVAATATVVIGACASVPTRVESTWLDPTYEGDGFERVAVLALFDTTAESRNFEERAVALLEESGVDAVAGHSILAPDVRYSQEDMERELMGAEVEGLLIYRLIAIDERRVYRRPGPYLSGVPRDVMWGDPFYWYYYPQWHYYWHWRSSYAVTRSPGYWSEYTFVTVESSLYDNDTDQLVWTAKSETIDGTEFDRLAGSVAAEITERLVELGLVGGAGA